MAAACSIRAYHGAPGGTPTADLTGTQINMKRADADTVDGANPTPIPAAGTYYSWRKSLKLYVDVGPDNTLQNLRLYSELQVLGAGRTLLCRTAAGYTQASVADEAGALGGAVDVDGYTSGAPLTVNAGQVVGAGGTGVGTQDFIELQLAVTNAAAPGNEASAKALVYRYDEA